MDAKIIDMTEQTAKNIVDFGFLAVFAGLILTLIVVLGFYAIRVWAKKQDAMLKAEEEKRLEDKLQRDRDYERIVCIENDTKMRLERVEGGIIPALDRLAEDQEKAAAEKKFWGEMTESLSAQLLGVSSILSDLATKQDITANKTILDEIKSSLSKHNVKQDEMYEVLVSIAEQIKKAY